MKTKIGLGKTVCWDKPKFGKAFSLVEVVLALGIISFAVVPLVGLLSVGLQTQRQSTEQARGVRMLGAVTSGIRSVNKSGTNYLFAAPCPGDLRPASASTAAFGYTEGGSLIADSDRSTSGRRGSLVVLQPLTNPKEQSRVAFISVAWPAAATWDGQKWKNASGSVESVVCFALPE